MRDVEGDDCDCAVDGEEDGLLGRGGHGCVCFGGNGYIGMLMDE